MRETHLRFADAAKRILSKMPSVTVAATGYGELSYQWYYCNADSVTWITESPPRRLDGNAGVSLA